MDEKDPLSYSVLTYAWVIALSISGGVASFFRKLKDGRSRAVNIMELLGEIFTSGFAGVITFYLCEWGRIDPLATAAMVGISGHMGSRVIAHFEQWMLKRLPSGVES